MEEFYNLANYFIESLSSLGDWLLNQPLNVLPDSTVLNNLAYLGLPDWVSDFLMSIKDASIGGLIFGGGLIGILSFKLLKFILDIVF